MSNIAVLRNNIDGDCFLVAVKNQEFGLDEPRLAEGNLELAGWLRYPRQYDSRPNTDENRRAPFFTTCSHTVDETAPEGDDTGRECGALILIVDDMAPDHCTEHENCGSGQPCPDM